MTAENSYPKEKIPFQNRYTPSKGVGIHPLPQVHSLFLNRGEKIGLASPPFFPAFPAFFYGFPHDKKFRGQQ